MDVQEERCIEGLVGEIKAELFSPSTNLYSLFPASAYDTAWVAMVPNPHEPERPMFPGCVKWILISQNPESGFWGDMEMTVQCLADTLACLVALKTWNVGPSNIENGLSFIGRNMEMLLKSAIVEDCFVIILPGMIELAQERGLHIFSSESYPKVINDLFFRREGILGTMNGNLSFHCEDFFQLELYLEALSKIYKKKKDLILLREQLGGLEFLSPSATACAFMITGDKGCFNYLITLVQRCGYGENCGCRMGKVYSLAGGVLMFSNSLYVQTIRWAIWRAIWRDLDAKSILKPK